MKSSPNDIDQPAQYHILQPKVFKISHIMRKPAQSGNTVSRIVAAGQSVKAVLASLVAVNFLNQIRSLLSPLDGSVGLLLLIDRQSSIMRAVFTFLLHFLSSLRQSDS